MRFCGRPARLEKEGEIKSIPLTLCKLCAQSQLKFLSAINLSQLQSFGFVHVAYQTSCINATTGSSLQEEKSGSGCKIMAASGSEEVWSERDGTSGTEFMSAKWEMGLGQGQGTGYGTSAGVSTNKRAGGKSRGTYNVNAQPGGPIPRPPALPKPSAHESHSAGVSRTGQGDRGGGGGGGGGGGHIAPSSINGANLVNAPYNLTHPLLLQEVTDMVAAGMKHITKEQTAQARDGLGDYSLLQEKWDNDRLAVYRSAFRHYAESSTLYKPFLRNVLEEFDRHMATLQDQLRMAATHQAEKLILVSQHAEAQRLLEAKHNAAMEKNLEELTLAKKKLAAAEKKMSGQEQERIDLKASTAKQREEWEEMRVSCATLTSSLQRYSEAAKAHKLSDANFIAKQSELTISEAKANNEAERLRLKNQHLEQDNSLLVRHEVVERKDNEIEKLKFSIRQKDDQHRQLLQRYGLVKSAIGRVYKKQQVDKGHKETDMQSLTPFTEAPPIMSPDQMVEDFAQKGGDIRQVIECLLNHIHILGTGGGNDGNRSHSPNGRHHHHHHHHHHNSQQDAELDETSIQDVWGGLLDEGLPKKAVKPMMKEEEVWTDRWPYEDTSDLDVARVVHDEDADGPAASTNTDPAAGHLPTQTDEAATAAGTVERRCSMFAHYTGLGTHKDLPSFLRLSGRVQNMFISRRDTGRLIHAVMNAARARKERLLRLLQEVSSVSYVPPKIVPGARASIVPNSVEKINELLNQPFSIFFEAFLKKRFFTVSRVRQVAFNLLESAKKFMNESDCRLFLLILNNDLPQDVWFDQDDTFNTVCATLQKKEYTSGTVVEGKRKLTVDDFLRTLRANLPHKSDLAARKLQRALALENKSSRYVLDIPSLLVEMDDEAPSRGGTGARGMFCEMLRVQHITQSLQFYQDVMESIDTVCGMQNPGLNIIEYNHQIQKPGVDSTAGGESNVVEGTITMFRKALLAVDPHKPRSELNDYMSRGLGVTLEQMLLMEGKRQRVPVAEFKQRLKNSLLTKSVASHNMQ